MKELLIFDSLSIELLQLFQSHIFPKSLFLINLLPQVINILVYLSINIVFLIFHILQSANIDIDLFECNLFIRHEIVLSIKMSNFFKLAFIKTMTIFLATT